MSFFSPSRSPALDGVVDRQVDQFGRGTAGQAAGHLGADHIHVAAEVGRGVALAGVVEPGDLRQAGRLAVSDPVAEPGLQVVGEIGHERPLVASGAKRWAWGPSTASRTRAGWACQRPSPWISRTRSW